MAIKMQPLPFDMDALEPHMSARTLEFHYGKHHKTYVDTANKLIKGTPYENQPLLEIVRATAKAKNGKEQKIFNNAGQAWNHEFFWQSLAKGSTRPLDYMNERLDRAFGGLDRFKKKFVEDGMARFGSGWIWLVEKHGELAIETTSNADSPLTTESTPLLVCDLWEHAYYLDYQNKRDEFLKAFVEEMINWSFAEANLENHAPQRTARQRGL